MFQELFMEDSESWKSLSCKFQGCFKRVSRLFQGYFLEVSKDISWKFQRRFQENVQGVSKKFHIAYHSSQLPEQKEGLFLTFEFEDI